MLSLVTATSTRPAISAAVLRDAATRLAGAVVLDVADLTVGPARYVPRLAAFAAIDSDEILGDDDGTLIVLVAPGVARDLIDQHRNAGRAAVIITRELRAAGVL